MVKGRMQLCIRQGWAKTEKETKTDKRKNSSNVSAEEDLDTRYGKNIFVFRYFHLSLQGEINKTPKNTQICVKGMRLQRYK